MLQIPSRACFLGGGGGGDASKVSDRALLERELARVRARVRGTMEMASLLEEWNPTTGFKLKGDLGLGLGF